uniref:Uncharacterized protein n=1 Tax=Arundo donax TaxID=35708 RepID=A0A0A8ZFD4_ARUDO
MPFSTEPEISGVLLISQNCMEFPNCKVRSGKFFCPVSILTCLYE